MSKQTDRDPLAEFDSRIQALVASTISYRQVRACVVATRDRDYALTAVRKAVVAAGTPLWHFTVSGRRRYETESMRWRADGGGGEDLEELLRAAAELAEPSVVVFEDGIVPARDDGGDLRARDRLRTMLSVDTNHTGLLLVFVDSPEATTHLPAVLEDSFVRLAIPYPGADELEAIARTEIARAARHEVETVRREATRLGAGLVGLTRSAARNALRDVLAGDTTDFDRAHQRLQARKSEQLERDLAMRVLTDADAELPIGLDGLVQHVEREHERMRRMGNGRARGMLLVGPPGTGKTMLAKAIGRIAGLPVVEFRISSLMNSLLGETERRFAQAFATLEAMAPLVVFIDEIEKAFGDSSERDGGTMMRVNGALLSWLSDNPHPCYVLGTANSLTRMGEIGLTMTRSGRFDAAFFVDVPSQPARMRMLATWLQNKVPQHLAVAARLAQRTDKFSGADLKSTVELAESRASHLKRPLDEATLLLEIERKRARTSALYDEFNALRRWGALYCDPADAADPTQASLSDGDEAARQIGVPDLSFGGNS